jgi:hypothetical protein
MTPERWQQVADTLDQILRCPAQQRSAYLSQIASSDPDLQVEVESLLASYEKADTAFLSGSAVESLAGERDTMRENMVGRRLGAYQLSECIAPLARMINTVSRWR